MTTYAKLESEGEIINVELDTSTISGEVPASLDDLSDKLQDSFDGAMRLIRVCGERITQSIRGISQRPDESSVEFGLKIDAEAGALIARAGTEAHFKVKLTWNKQDSVEKDKNASKS